MIKNPIYFFVAIAFLLPQSLDYTIDLLQLMQPKPYTTNIGFIRSFIS